MLWTLAAPGGRTRRAPPPLTTAAQWFFMPKTLIFLIFSSVASLAIHFKSNFSRNMAKTR